MSGFVLTPRARADLKAIWTYTADRWIIEQADRYVGLLHRAMQIAAAEPRRWRSCDQIRSGVPSFQVCHLYYPRRRQHTPAFALLVDVLRYRG